MGATAVRDVEVICSTDEFGLSATVRGLLSGTSVVLRVEATVNDSGGALGVSVAADIAVSEEGPMALTRLPSSAAYVVMVKTQPTDPVQTCSVNNGRGTMGAADVTDIEVICSPDAYPVSVAVRGLASGASVVLQNNGRDDLQVTTNGLFMFREPVAEGARYEVSVSEHPTSPRQACEVTNGTGVVSGAPTTGAIVTCTTLASFTTTGPMTAARDGATATLLPDGLVLVAGGSNLNSAELFNPATGTFRATGNMNIARTHHTATLLPNGTVLVAGGSVPHQPTDTGPLATDTAELYNPATGIFTPAGRMTSARYYHTATLLPTGQVLEAGGSIGTGRLTSAELFDPATGGFTGTGGMATGRTSAAATLLPDGSVLVAGGSPYPASGTPYPSAEVYVPAARSFHATGSMTAMRSGATATVLSSGRVLLAGGSPAVAELYDPTTGTFSASGSLSVARSGAAAAVLPNGTVLVAGGSGSSSAELYDPDTLSFALTGSMHDARENHTLTLLPDGKVLVAGGYSATSGAALSSAELYAP